VPLRGYGIGSELLAACQDRGVIPHNHMYLNLRVPHMRSRLCLAAVYCVLITVLHASSITDAGDDTAPLEAWRSEPQCQMNE
jgi:hypothetical protein